MTHRTLILAVGCLVLLFTGAAFAQQDAPPPPVVVAKVTTGDMAP
jgi:hypothetical protein